MRGGLWLAVFVVFVTAAPARADWQVRRQDGSLARAGVAALLERPDDPALAGRVVRSVGARAAIDQLKAETGRTPRRYEPWAALGQALLATGRAPEAIEAFDEAAAILPTLGAAVGRARALMAAGRAGEASQAFEQAMDLAQPAARPALLRSWAQAADRAGDHARAVKAYRGLMQLRPADRGAFDGLVKALDRAGQPAEAAELLESRAATSTRRADDLRRAAELRARSGDTTAARLLLEKALADAAPSARVELEERLIAMARRTDGLPDLHAKLSASADRRRWGALSRVRHELGDFEGALEAAQRAWQESRGDRAAAQRVLSLLDRLGKHAEAATFLDDLERRHPYDPDLPLAQIERSFRANRRDDGRKRFDRTLDRYRGDADTLARLADLASRFGEDDRVLAAWQAVLARAPFDERAILGIGEAHFARGRRELARRSWRSLLGAIRPEARARARLAEILAEHDLIEEALAEARSAIKLDPKAPEHLRTLARVLERAKDTPGAIVAWQTLLNQSSGEERAAERREARLHLLSLLARDGRARLETEATRTRQALRERPDDRDATLFLAELELKLLAPERATALLREAAARWPEDSEVTAALVRLLKQSRQLGEAVTRLQELARRVPARATDLWVQIAELELERSNPARAIEATDRAAASAPAPEALARIAELQARAGDATRAEATARTALDAAPSSRAARLLVRVLVARGAADEALLAVVRAAATTTDPDLRGELLSQALSLAEPLGRWDEVERHLHADGSGDTHAERAVVVDMLRRRLPALLRATDANARRERDRLARLGLRAALDQLLDTPSDPDPRVIELVGQLGSRYATRVLTRLLTTGDRTRTGLRAPIAVALGRIGDPRAAADLAPLTRAREAAVRAAALWALGRSSSEIAAEPLAEACQAAAADTAALGCLGVGRLGDADGVQLLKQTVRDETRPTLVREAALLGLGWTAADGRETLFAFTTSADVRLASAAMTALAIRRDRAGLATLWERAMRGQGPVRAAAIHAWQLYLSEAPADESPALPGGTLDAETVVRALVSLPPAAHPADRWVGRLDELEGTLRGALAGTASLQVATMAALEGRTSFTLALLPPEALSSPRARGALEHLASRLGPLVKLRLDDPSNEVKWQALKLAAKMKGLHVAADRVARTLAEAPIAGLAGGGAEQAVLAAVGGKTLPPEERTRLVRHTEPLLSDASWERRLSAVRVLRRLGPEGTALLMRARADRHPLVREEASSATTR